MKLIWDEKILKKYRFSMTTARRPLICCVNWFSNKHQHPIKTGEPILWKNKNGRPMGHCKECAESIMFMAEKQTKLF